MRNVKIRSFIMLSWPLSWLNILSTQLTTLSTDWFTFLILRVKIRNKGFVPVSILLRALTDDL